MKPLPDTEIKIGRIRRWLIVSDPKKVFYTILAVSLGLGLVFGLVVAIFVPDHHRMQPSQHTSLPIAVIELAIPILILIGVLFTIFRHKNLRGFGFNSMIQDRNDYLGRVLSGQDRLALYKWGKYGAIPADKKLQPILPRWVDYKEQLMDGQRPYAKLSNKILIIIFGANILLQIFNAVLSYQHNHHLTIGPLLNAGYFILLFIFLLAINPLRPSGLALRRKIYKRQYGKIARMRYQLGQ